MDNRELVEKLRKRSGDGCTCPACVVDRLAAAALESAEKTVQEVGYIANAKRFDRDKFADDTEFADWAQSRCRAALSAKGSSCL